MSRICLSISLFALLLATASAWGEKPVPPRNTNESVEVLSNTRGFDFHDYIESATHAIKANWLTLIPYEAQPPREKKGKVAVEFVISKNGSVDDIRVTRKSGTESFDRAAMASVIATNPLPELPDKFSGDSLKLRLWFFYNTDVNKPK